MEHDIPSQQEESRGRGEMSLRWDLFSEIQLERAALRTAGVSALYPREGRALHFREPQWLQGLGAFGRAPQRTVKWHACREPVANGLEKERGANPRLLTPPLSLMPTVDHLRHCALSSLISLTASSALPQQQYKGSSLPRWTDPLLSEWPLRYR